MQLQDLQDLFIANVSLIDYPCVSISFYCFPISMLFCGILICTYFLLASSLHLNLVGLRL